MDPIDSISNAYKLDAGMDGGIGMAMREQDGDDRAMGTTGLRSGMMAMGGAWRWRGRREVGLP